MDSALAPPDPRPTSITSAADRPTARQQIEQILAGAKTDGEPLRVRIPVTLYNAAANRSYTPIADAAWNLTFDAHTAPEVIEALILTIGKCLVAITMEGSATVLRKLEASAPEGSL